MTRCTNESGSSWLIQSNPSDGNQKTSFQHVPTTTNSSVVFYPFGCHNNRTTRFGQAIMSPREPETLLSTSSSTSSLDTLEDKDDELPKKTSRIQWGNIQIREYNRIVGDNPETIVGPPLTLDWQYNEHELITIDEYEETRPKRKVFWRLRLSSITRKNMLKNVFGIPESEIAAAEREVQIIRRLRQSTNKQGKLSSSVENAVQSAKRKIKRRFSRENAMMSLSAAYGKSMALQTAY